MNKNSELNRSHLTYDQSVEIEEMHSKERRIISAGLVIVILVTIQDFFEDMQQGQAWFYVLGDIFYMLVMLGLLAYIWRHAPLTLKKRNLMLTQEVIKQHSDAKSWRNRASELLQGLGSMINQQFTEWGLSLAEKEIALLILKGLSLKEIAAMRDTSERTVRQQATQIYTKARVSNRAELSTFFLEDLLLPID